MRSFPRPTFIRPGVHYLVLRKSRTRSRTRLRIERSLLIALTASLQAQQTRGRPGNELFSAVGRSDHAPVI